MMYYIHRYEHIDMMQGMKSPTSPVRDKTMGNLDRHNFVLKCITDAFKKAGWEGDGDLTAFWLPPFACPIEDTHGEWLYHVKQLNNGTSFIAATFDLSDQFPDTGITLEGAVNVPDGALIEMAKRAREGDSWAQKFFTCYGCAENKTCDCAWDAHNTNGYCLADK